MIKVLEETGIQGIYLKIIREKYLTVGYLTIQNIENWGNYTTKPDNQRIE